MPSQLHSPTRYPASACQAPAATVRAGVLRLPGAGWIPAASLAADPPAAAPRRSCCGSRSGGRTAERGVALILSGVQYGLPVSGCHDRWLGGGAQG